MGRKEGGSKWSEGRMREGKGREEGKGEESRER